MQIFPVHPAEIYKIWRILLYNFNEVKYNTPNASLLRKERYIMKRIIALSLVVISVLLCLAGCGSTASNDSDLAYVQNNGKLIVGITDYAPMDYKDEATGEWIGFDAEFAQMFAEELGVEVEFFVLADWGKKFFELDSKNIDVIWNGMTINEDVTLNTNCSDPYVVNAQVVVAKADVVANITAESLKDLSVAVESGSAGEAALVDIGITDYVALQDQTSALMEVAAGTAEACVIDITMANAMTGAGTSYADLAPGISLTSEEYGVAFRKDSDITAEFNKIMAKLMADGTLQALADKYQLTLAK